MRKIYITILSLFPVLLLNAQNIPIDFESGGHGANWNWAVFENTDNPPLEIVANPDPSGINTSATVAKFTARQTGNPWAGCESLHGAGIGSWTINPSNSTIRIMVWKDVISDVGIKLVRVDSWSLGEIKIANTLTNQWEQLTFDFSSHMDTTYDQIVIFPDFDLSGRSSDNIIYFDNVYGAAASPVALEAISENAISIYPNPVKDQLSISSAIEIDQVSIFNTNGQLLMDVEIKATNANLNTSDFQQGVYILKTLSSGQVHVQKFIKD
ncbi:MAG: T9SS type A sorting domain-containing protein [Cytophagales bacterium]